MNAGMAGMVAAVEDPVPPVAGGMLHSDGAGALCMRCSVSSTAAYRACFEHFTLLITGLFGALHSIRPAHGHGLERWLDRRALAINGVPQVSLAERAPSTHPCELCSSARHRTCLMLLP